MQNIRVVYHETPTVFHSKQSDEILVRELALFALNDEMLYQACFKKIYEETDKELAACSFRLSRLIQLYFNTVPLVTKRYEHEFGKIGCRMNVMERYQLAWEMASHFFFDLFF